MQWIQLGVLDNNWKLDDLTETRLTGFFCAENGLFPSIQNSWNVIMGLRKFSSPRLPQGRVSDAHRHVR